jgi:polysaccharide transporter, PST family
MFPVWFFQGIEDMKFITIINLISKLVSTVGIFVLVKHSDDYLLVPILNSIGFIIAAVISLLIVRKKYNIKFMLPNIKDVNIQLKEGWYLFLSTAAINFYTVSNTFILGIFTNPIIVAYYSSAEKIINAATGLIGPLSQTLYPHISQLVKESKTQAITFINKLVKIVGILTGVVSICIFIFAESIVAIVLGQNFENSVNVLRILSLLPLLIGLSNIFGIQTMLTFNFKKEFSNILIIASIVNMILAFILVPVLKDIGTSISVLISEIAVTLIMYLFLRSKGILFNSRGKRNV